MLIRFFKSSFLIQYLALAIIAIVLWLPALINHELTLVPRSPVSPLYNLILEVVPDVGWLPVLLALILTISEALILNNIFIYHDLIPKNSLLPAILFILFMSSGTIALTLHPAILALLPLSFFLHQLFQLYDVSENLNKTLGVGLLASVCSMLYAPLAVLMVFILLVFLVYRILHWREWFVALLGFFLPYLYLVVFYFWTDQLGLMAAMYVDYFIGIFSFTGTDDLFQVAVWIVFALLMLFPGMVRILSTLGSHNIAFRRKMTATVWLAIFGALMAFTPGEFAHKSIVYLPAAGIVAYLFHSMKKSAWNELVMLAYLLMIGAHNYLSLPW